jgi:hypothetical protein
MPVTIPVLPATDIEQAAKLCGRLGFVEDDRAPDYLIVIRQPWPPQTSAAEPGVTLYVRLDPPPSPNSGRMLIISVGLGGREMSADQAKADTVIGSIQITPTPSPSEP